LGEETKVATASLALFRILHETADRIEAGAEYQWSHFGKCNCGHLAQTATRLTAAQIHQSAFCRLAEWSEIPDDFCPQSGVLIDRVVDTLFEIGLTAGDLRHLEDLSDPEILHNLSGGFRYLERNRRQDAVAYLRSWADLIRPGLEDTEPGVVAGGCTWPSDAMRSLDVRKSADSIRGTIANPIRCV
jgi:hypothetical protein